MAARRRVVILGSGWAGNKMARSLDKAKFDVRIVSPSNHFLFTPMLPSAAVGTLEFRAIQEPIRTIEGLGEYYQAKACGIDNLAKTIECSDSYSRELFRLKYDYLVLATGSQTNTFGTPGVSEDREDVSYLKHLHHARKIRNRILECFERASNPSLREEDKRKLLTFVVVGGGATSCEFTAELSDFVTYDVKKWYPRLASLVKVVLVEAGPNILTAFDDALAGYYSSFLIKRGIDLRTGVAVKSLREASRGGGASEAVLSDGSALPFGLVVWSAGLAPVDLVRETSGILPSRNGRIVVDDYLRCGDDDIFAIGDCAIQENTPLPPTASVAEQHASYLASCFNNTYFKDASVKQTPDPVYPAAMPTKFLGFLDRTLFKPSSKFRYVERGAMASMGFGRGIADLSKTDVPGAPTISGFAAFVAWRGAYLSKQLSWSNMMLVPMFWFKSLLFGRDISRF